MADLAACCVKRRKYGPAEPGSEQCYVCLAAFHIAASESYSMQGLTVPAFLELVKAGDCLSAHLVEASNE